MGRIARIAESVFGPPLNRAAEAEVGGLFDYQVPEWWRQNIYGVGTGSGVRLSERVWVANRCQQMNAQQIGSMPLKFHGPEGAEPAWVSDPDPNLYPNGIGDAVFSIVDQMYGWGFALLYVTDWYATLYPRRWTVLNSSQCEVKLEGGARRYFAGQTELDPSRIVQIDRNPGPRAHGTPALKAYASTVLGLIAAGEQATAVNSGLYPSVMFRPKRPVTEAQAEKLQAQWVEKTMQRRGAPPVVPPDIDVEALQIDPAALQLLEAQDFGVRAICSAYGVPSMLLNFALSGALAYQNPAALGEAWWRFELRNVADRIENALSNRMLPRGQYVSVEAEDTWAVLTPESDDDDPQAAEDDPSADSALAPTPPVAPTT